VSPLRPFLPVPRTGPWPPCRSNRYGWVVSIARSTPSTRRPLPVCGRARAWAWRGKAARLGRARPGGRLAWAGKGDCPRAGRAVRANIVAALTSVVIIHGVRVGLVRRTRFGPSCQDAVAHVFDDLPPTPGKRLLVVDAGIATKEQFAAATAQDALLGRLRINVKLRCAPPPPTGKPARRPAHRQ